MTTQGMTWTQKPRRRAWGYAEGQRIRGAIGFSPAMFEQVSELAFRTGLSFQEQVRRLVQAGLDATRVESARKTG